jgi:hypothetical protein
LCPYKKFYKKKKKKPQHWFLELWGTKNWNLQKDVSLKIISEFLTNLSKLSKPQN